MRFPQGFKPTPAMHLYAFQRAKLGETVTEKAISEKIQITAETISRWKQVNGFTAWLEEQVAVYRSPLTEILEQVAMKNLDDYRYWEAMAKKYGVIAKEGAPPAGNGGMQVTPEQLVELVKSARAQAHVSAAVAATTGKPDGQV